MKSFPWINRVGVLAITLGVTAASCTPQLGRQAFRLPTATESDVATTATLQAPYGHLPLHFEANQGQTDSQVQFLARGHGYSLFLTSSEAVLVLRQKPGARSQEPESKTQPPTVLRMQLLGANPNPQVQGLKELPGTVNYFLGHDPTQWRPNLSTYAKVHYQQVYPGVDLVYYGHQQQLEYDFVVAPGADPKVIQLTFAGADNLAVDAGGDLLLQSDGGELRLHKPRVYQEIDGVQQEIAGGYVLLDETQDSGLQTPDPRLRTHQVGFAVATYDTSRPLIIDPVLSYSTYLGGNLGDIGNGITIDAAGNIYVTGRTGSTDFPTKNPLQANCALGGSDNACLGDAFVTKLNAAAPR